MAYEIEIKKDGAEFEIKGDTLEGVIKIAESLGLTVKTGTETTAINLATLKAGDRVKSVVENAGGFRGSWAKIGTEGEVISVDEEGAYVRVVESGQRRWFTNGELACDLVKVI